LAQDKVNSAPSTSNPWIDTHNYANPKVLLQ